ncbi:MAG: DNA-3-methyladenine glycosylase 2 family protein [Gammaproteobacteria bacterium]|nr:DNA-3-methyladenine glycosylase 2 family protein [Gammaproteobacteria bacterium]
MNNAVIRRGLAQLAAGDSDLAEALERIGPPSPRIRPAGFETLLSTIISQQLSTESAQAIKRRVLNLLPQITAGRLLEVDSASLRAAGLSYRKIEYARGLATAITERTFDVDRLIELSDEDAIASITGLRGFGRWSAEIYLMFSLGRRDVFPADDLALQIALGRLKGLAQRPNARRARALTEHWRPWRSVGALFLWHYYRGAPDQ